MSRRVGAVAILLTVVLPACGPGDEASALPGTRRDSAGVEIVRHGRLEVAETPVFAVEYRTEVPESLPGGAGELGFVADADLFPDGNLAVLDRQPRRSGSSRPTDGSCGGSAAGGRGPGSSAAA